MTRALVIAMLLISGTAAAQGVTVTPKQPWVERTKLGQSVSFDFVIENHGKVKLELAQIRLRVTDAKGALVLRKQAWSGVDAALPASPQVPAGGKLVVLNPFYLFDGSVELARMAYELVLVPAEDGGGDAKPQTIAVTVAPKAYATKTQLGLPVRGRALVYEGHDYLAHHRRVDLANPVVGKLGITTNPTRYSYDLCVVDATGELFKGTGARAEDWYGFGTPVVAPGAGVVTEVRATVDDNVLGEKLFDFALALKDVKAFYGNYVMLGHGNGEYSVLAHLKKGSITVKAGERVTAGQVIAQMGLSGDSEFVHVHYQLQDGLDRNSEALPAYFRGVELRRGARAVPAAEGVALDSGDLVEAR